MVHQRRVQYQSRLSAALKQAYGAFFNAYTLLFVGYGLADDDLDLILGRIRAFAGNQPVRHFAMIPADAVGPHRRKILDGAGVSLVPYSNENGDHRELVKMLQAIAGEELPRTESATPVPPVREKLTGVSEAAQRIVDERGAGWEFRLFSQVLSDELRASGRLRKDLSFGVAFGEMIRCDLVEGQKWMAAHFATMTQLSRGLVKLVNVGLGDAFGAVGEHGDPEKIVYVANRIGDIYREIIAWAMRWSRIHSDPTLDRVIEIGPKAGEAMLAQIEEWNERMRATLSERFRGSEDLAPGEVLRIPLPAISVPGEWEAEMERELSNIAGRIELGQRLAALRRSFRR